MFLYLKQVRRVKNTWSENDIGNTLAYDVKSCQVRMTILNFTNVQLKKIKKLTSHIRDFIIANVYMKQL